MILPDNLKNKVDNFTPLQRRYCEFRAKGLTQAQSARNAGSEANPENLGSFGYQIEQMDGSKEYIQFIQNEKSKIAPVDELEITAMLRTIYDLSMEAGAFKDANKSVELLGNTIGLFGKVTTKQHDQSKSVAEQFNDMDDVDDEKTDRAERVQDLLKQLK